VATVIVVPFVGNMIPSQAELMARRNRPKQSKLYEITDVTCISILHFRLTPEDQLIEHL
jgi:hypothetical protein